MRTLLRVGWGDEVLSIMVSLVHFKPLFEEFNTLILFYIIIYFMIFLNKDSF